MVSTKFTSKEIDALPTILDVVERISAFENKSFLQSISDIPSYSYYDEGRFCYVSNEKNRSIVNLMPTSQTTHRYYRGQSRYYDPCYPNLYRKKASGEYPSDVDIASDRIQTCEFASLLITHPVFNEVRHNIQTDAVALAQHYGLKTEYLDITNNKWVAAFFASTSYDKDTESYHPVGRDYKEGYGVMYISKSFDTGQLTEEFYEKNDVIGYQYFDRPSKQSSFGYKLDKGEDFNASPYFDQVFFRHDLEASTIVYDMAYRQNRFIPNDELSKLARQIFESKEVTRNALNNCWGLFYKDKSPAFLDEVCKSKKWRIREDNTPIAQFSEEVLAEDWKRWIEFGREDLKSRIIPSRIVAYLP